MPPIAAQPAALVRATTALSISRRDVLAQRLDLLALGLVAVGQEALGHAHGAERPRARVDRRAVLDAGELHRAAAEVEHDALGERRRVDRRQVAVAGLLLARRAPRPPARSARAPRFRNSAWLAASRIADVATGRISSIPVAVQKCA